MEGVIQTFNFNPLPIEVEVKELSFVKQHPRLMGNPHKVRFHQIIWLSEGSAIFRVDFRDITLNAGQLFVIAQEQVCQFDVTSQYEGKLILFTEDFFNVGDLYKNFLYTSEVFNPVSLNRIVDVDAQSMSVISGLLSKEISLKPDVFQNKIAHNYLTLILLEAERRLTLYTPQTDTLGRRFYNAVEQYYRKNRHTDFYTELLGVNEKTLSREVKKVAGKTPKAYLDFRTILEAKRLLSYSNLSAKEIAFELGFDEPTNFHKYFRKQVGLTPIEFRNTTQE